MKSLRQARVLLADDHAIVRQGLLDILRESMPRAKFGEARTGQETVELVRRQVWDILLLDISLPDRSGIEILKEVRGLDPKLPVLILTMHPEEEFGLRSLRAGAAGYLTKNTDPKEIVVAVGRVLARGRYISESLAEELATEFRRDGVRMPHERLSDREFEVFGLLARGHTVKEIAARLKISAQTVSTHRSRVIDKMGLRTNADLVQYAVRHALVDGWDQS